MKKIKLNIKEAIGKRLYYDVTGIIPKEFKGPIFRKGHLIKKNDIKKLLEAGKDNIWVLKLDKDEYHENEAGVKFKKLAGKNVKCEGPVEGKITFISKIDGLFIIEREVVYKINRIKDILLATKPGFIKVKKGDKLGGIRILPLATKRKNVERVLKFKKLFNVLPFKSKKVGLIITGNEIFYGRIKDKFQPVIEEKISEYGSLIISKKILPDDENLIKEEILRLKKFCDLIIITAGMSVDADDVTVLAMKKAKVKILRRGTPVLPGNMLHIGYLGKIPVFGVPACLIHDKITSFDIFLPLALADVKITKEMILSKSYGGFCAHCEICVYPNCYFGK
jgi:hypothetical protein